MTDEETAQKIIEMLLALPWEKREDVIAAVKYNRIFCWHCGMGERDRPNPYCRCSDDS